MSATGDVIERGNVAVIKGGASGIGMAVAERLIAERMQRAAERSNPTIPTGD